MRVPASSERPLRVAIDAQVRPDEGAGGIESVLIGLIHALGRLEQGPEEYVIIGPWQNPWWLTPHLGPNQRIVAYPKPAWARGALGPIHRALKRTRAEARRTWRLLRLQPTTRWADRRWRRPAVPVSNGFHESLGCDVVHFQAHFFLRCALPSVYNPHDLQHLHYPEFFSPAEVAWLECLYQAGCRAAHTVAVSSRWVKDDIVRQYGLEPRKIQVIPWAATLAHRPPSPDVLLAVQRRYGLEAPFALYPANTWAHKNHVRLLEAVARLRDRAALGVNVICPGQKGTLWPRIEQRRRELGLEAQVRFPGLLPREHLQAMYALAQYVVIPTLFEATSGLLREAWQARVPAACAAVTSLPEQAGDAALLFDPLSVASIADAMAQMCTRSGLREDLRRRGAVRVQDFTDERTAKAYRAVYRRAAGRKLSDEDRWFLSWDWMREPHRKPEVPGPLP